MGPVNTRDGVTVVLALGDFEQPMVDVVPTAYTVELSLSTFPRLLCDTEHVYLHRAQ